MARITATKSSESASAATFTPDLSDHESGDVIAVWVVHARAASTISIDGTDTSNFTDPSGSFDTKEAGSGTNVSCALFICEASSSAEAGPLLTQNTAADEWYAMCHTYKDCKAADVIEAANTASFSSAKNGTLLQVTPTNSNCLVAYFMCADTNARGSQFQAGIEGFCADTATLDIASGIIQHAPASTITPALEWIGTLGAQDGVYATIAFNDSGSTAAPGLDASNLNTAAQLPNFSTTPSTAAFNVTAAPTDLTSLFDGSWPFSTPVNLAPSGGSTFAIQPEIKGAGACMASVASIGGSHNGQHVISAVSINSVSFTGKLLLLTIGHSAGAAKLGDISQGGGYIVLSDGTEIAAFRVTALNSSPTSVNGTMGVVIDPINTTPTYESANVGSIDFTAITSIGVMHYVTTVTESFCIAGVNTLDVSSNKAFIARGGHAAQPVSFETFFGPLNSQGLKAFPNQSGFTAGQYFSPVPLQIGDGTVATTTNLNTQALAFPGAAAARYISYFLPTNSHQLRIKASASDSFTSGSCVIDMGDFHQFIIDSGSSTSATYDFDGLTVLNGEVTLQDLGANKYTGATFSGCNQINTGTLTNASAFGGVTVKDCVETYAVAVTSETEFNAWRNAAFDGNNYSIQITGNHGGATWTATGMTIANRTGTYDVQYTGTGTLTITTDAGQSWAGEATVGTLTITAATTSVTVNTNVAATIRIYDGSSTQTITASDTAATTLVHTYTGTHTWYYTVDAEGYLPQRGNFGSLTNESATATITLQADPIYNASHGLTFGTEFSYSSVTREITIDGATHGNQEGRDIYSGMISAFFDGETTTLNRPFPLKAVGPDRIDFLSDGTTGATLNSGDIQYWKGAGMQWEHNTTGNPTKKFYSIKSSNTLQASSVVGYTQTNTGTPVEATLVSNQVNQVIQFYEDTDGNGTPDYDRKTHLLFKGFLTGYYQARWDVINDGGITELEPYEYTISLTQEAIAGTTGDQAVTITTLTDHTGAPIDPASSGDNFDYELVDPGTNTAAVLLAQHNYNIYTAVNADITGALYTSYVAFELPDLIIEAGSSHETEAGYFEGDGLVTDRSGVYVSRSSADHPDISRFQSNDLTYYTPAVTANGTITGLVDAGAQADDRLQIENTTALSAADWQASTAYSAGDIVKRTSGLGTENTAGLFFRCTTGGTSGGTEPTWVITTPGVFGTAGSETTDNDITWECFAVLLYDADPTATSWSDSYIDGEEFASGETGTYRFSEMDEGTTFKKASATFITTSAGFTVSASSVLEANSVYAENALDGSAQDSIYSPNYNADGATDYIVMDTNTDFRNPKTFAYYCYLLTTSEGMYNLWDAVTAIDAGNYRNNVDIAKIMFDETAGFVKQEDSDNSRWFNSDGSRPFLDPTTGGSGIHMNWKNPVYVTEVNTGSAVNQATVQAALTAQGYTTARAGKIDQTDDILADTDELQTNQGNWLTATGFATVNPDNATIAETASALALVKANTDQMEFSVDDGGNTNQHVNIRSVNNEEISGTGVEGDYFGPANG